MKKHFASPTIILLSLVFVFACKPDNIDVSVPAASSTPVSIAITPAPASMAPGSTLQLKAEGTFSNNQKRDITAETSWNSSNPEVAAVDGAGVVTSQSVTSGSATITASSGGATGSTMLTLSPAVSVRIAPANPAMAVGSVRQLSAVAILQNGAEQDITSSAIWNSSDPVVTMIGSGLASAPPGIPGSSTISATFSAVTGTTLLVTSDLQRITVAPFNPTVVAGTTRQFSATGILANNAMQDLTSFATWSSSNNEVAIVNSSGLAAAAAAGSSVITASFGSVSGAALLTVQEPAPASSSVSSPTQSIPQTVSSGQPTTTIVAPLIVVTPSAPRLVLGTTAQFSFLVISPDGTVLQDLTSTAFWTSSDTTIAFVSQGFVTTLRVGTATITARSGSLSASTNLTVNPF